jgi:formylglycine-generating enzyme required for sulfatase activity
MSDFDPYHIWLGIPETERPISKYRLLALVDFEVNREVISAAAERQTIYLRTLQAGEHEVLVAELLNEVSQARVTLLNAEQKAGYDEGLRKQQSPEPVPEPTPPPIPVVQPPAPTPVVVRGTVTQDFPVSVVQTAKGPRRRKQQQIWKRPAVIGVSVIGVIGVLALLMSLMSSGDADPVASNTPPVVTSPIIPSPQPEPRPTTPPQQTQPTASNETLPAKVAVAPPLAVAPFDAAQATVHQQAWSKYVGVPVEYTNSIGMKFMLIPPGEFMMGASSGADIQKPPCQVMFTKAFEIGIYEVTQEQYARVMQSSPSAFKGPENPVDQVSWTDAFTFCQLLSQLAEETSAGCVYRLPTEAEWEYACRAGTDTAYSFGDSAANYGSYAWFNGNSGRHTHPVGQKKPNAWGLYDVHGNVWEWCHDWYADLPSGSVVEPTGPALGSRRVAHGGGYYSGHTVFTSRMSQPSDYRKRNHGFRVVLEIPVRAQPNTIAADAKSLPASLTKRLVTRPPFRDNIKEVILALSFDGDEVVTQEGNMYLKDSSPVVNIVHTNSAAFVSTPTGEGMVFDGFDDTVLVSNFRSQLTQKKEGLTVACLLKITKPGFVLDIGADGQQLSLVNGAFMFMQSGSYPDTVRNDEMSPKLDQWLMMVGTWDGNKETTYVNGEIYYSRTGRVQGPISDRSFPSAGGYNHLYLGQQNKGFRRTGRGFGGILDELLLFKRALSAAEVKSLYDFEKP